MSTSVFTPELPFHSLTEAYLSENLPNQKSILNILNTKCTNSFKTLKQAHALILKTGHIQDHFIAGSLIKCYGNPYFNSLDTLFQVLEQVPEPNVFVLNCMIKGCLNLKQPSKAISIYHQMVISGSRPNKYTYPALFKACTSEKAVSQGLQIHGHVVKHGFNTDGYVIAAGVQMYSLFGFLEEAHSMLDSLGKLDVICWNTMIDGYMKFGKVENAVKLFDEMPDKSVSSWNTMVSGFSNNGVIEEAVKYFNQMPEKDEVSWSAMIDGFNKVGKFKEALGVFNQMQVEGISPSKFVLSSALSTCANIGALDQGEWIHAYIKKYRIAVDALLGTSLVNMYAKCGRLDLTWDVFEKMKLKEVFSWNAMIGALAMYGRAEDAIELFTKMDSKPNDITLVALLNACAHAGLVEKGLEYFITMKERYGVEPTVEHYGCAVNLLGKAGFFNEAEDLITYMPMKPNSAVWGALLGACKIHGNVGLGEKIGEILLDLEPENSGRYTLLSNIYAKAGKWDSLEKVRKLMKERGVKTITGKSIMEINGEINEFKVGDSSHPQTKEIHQMLEKIIQEIRLNGYKADTSEVLFDINEEEKETSLKYHSEKIAIAFGILNTEPGVTIRIMKNLRVCEDCHSATKIISRVYKRDIIVRDRVRYHHFRNGQCSCKDFW